MHSEDDLFLGEFEHKRAHVATLEQYNRRIMAVAFAVSRLRAQYEWSPPSPVSRSILRTFAQNAPPEYARIFLSNEHIEFMLKCQRIAEHLRDPMADFYTDARNITEYSVRYYRETQDVMKNYTTTEEHVSADYPLQMQAATGVGVPDTVEAYQASIEDSDGTPANVRDNDAIEAIRDLFVILNEIKERIPTEETIEKQTQGLTAVLKNSKAKLPPVDSSIGTTPTKMGPPIDSRSDARKNYDSLDNKGKNALKQSAALDACKGKNLHLNIRDIEILWGLPVKSLNRPPYKSIIDRGRSKERQARGEVRKRARKDRTRKGKIKES